MEGALVLLLVEAGAGFDPPPSSSSDSFIAEKKESIKPENMPRGLWGSGSPKKCCPILSIASK